MHKEFELLANSPFNDLIILKNIDHNLTKYQDIIYKILYKFEKINEYITLNNDEIDKIKSEHQFMKSILTLEQTKML